MDETPDRLNGTRASLEERTERLRAEIRGISQHLGELVAALDRRRHEATDVRLQLRRHGRTLAIAGLVTVAAVAGLVTWAMARSRRRRTLGGRAGALRDAFVRGVRHPERLFRDHDGVRPGAKILQASGVAGASLLTRRALERLLR
jgi:hypothetical protein